MKLFVSIDFTGQWPVGAAAVVYAVDENMARGLLDVELKKRGLKFDGTLIELPLNDLEPWAIVLQDGEY